MKQTRRGFLGAIVAGVAAVAVAPAVKAEVAPMIPDHEWSSSCCSLPKDAHYTLEVVPYDSTYTTAQLDVWWSDGMVWRDV